jgi:16S rRNA (adenine1518-N6/adenine1519-N6)-dimethyltransferase
VDFNSTNNFLKSTKLNPSKKLGQNFLIDEKFSKSLIDSVDFNGVDTILEIGPGLGAITQYLDKTSIRLILIELDKRLAENIKKQYKHLTVINDNCLDVD